MTALGRYSATQDAEKPLAPVHVVVMPDKSISFGVELTGTGELIWDVGPQIWSNDASLQRAPAAKGSLTAALACS